MFALAGSLHFSYASVCRVDEFQTLDLHVSYSDLLAQTELGYIDIDAIRESGVDTLYFQLTHILNQLTTGFNTLSETVQLNRNLNYYRLLLVNGEEIDMQRLAVNRVELELLNDRFRLGVTDGEVNDLRVRAVNQFTYVSCSNGERAVQTQP